MSVVLGVFSDRNRAERAAGELRSMGLHDRISIVAKGGEGEGHGSRPGGGGGERQGPMTMRGGGGEATTGAGVGAAIGGAGGLLAAAGMFAVPGIGPILALGPLAAGLSGAAAGGLVGGLVDLGVPQARSQHYEGHVKQGRILCTVEAEGREREVREVLERHGATEVEAH